MKVKQTPFEIEKQPNVQRRDIFRVVLEHEDVFFFDYQTNTKKFSYPISYFKEENVQYLYRFPRCFAGVMQESDVTNTMTLTFFLFADLHRHSAYSFLDGGISTSDLAERTHFVGAITDHGNMHGTLNYYQQMQKQGKFPIVGMEAYAETINGEKEGHHLLLLAKNETGYKNLAKLTSASYHNFYKKPHISYDMLADHHEGLIATTTCMGSEVCQTILKKGRSEAEIIVKEMQGIFKDDYYVEIQRHGFEDELTVNPALQGIAEKHQIKMIAATDTHYPDKKDKLSHEVLLCIGTNKKITDDNRLTFEGSGYHLHEDEEIETLFSDLPEAVANTVEIANKCKNLTLGASQPYLPHFPLPKGFTDEFDYLTHLAWKGFEWRFKGTDAYESEEYRERLEFELSTIGNMGFPGYFLIVEDIIRFAKEEGIIVGPGRGSAAGSLVSYCLNITNLDPIEYDLLFERFLNPDRISMPDIDIDFQDDRRDEVTEYARKKYGYNTVSKIATFGTLSAKSAFKAVAKVYNKNFQEAHTLTETFPKDGKVTLEQAYEESAEFRERIDHDETYKMIYEHALVLEGLPRNISQHACGVVIADGLVDDYIPTIQILNDDTGEYELTTQYDMNEVEHMGLLKMDFLALRTLRVIADAFREVNQLREAEGLSPYVVDDTPIDDPRVYQEISKGETYGVFQIESEGMRKFMTELFADVTSNTAPSTELFERLIAGISLYRPGPMDHIPEFIENMKNPDQIVYDTPAMKPILQSTYGVIVYQEQTMAIVRTLANFTRGEADTVRKAFAKPKNNEELLKSIQQQFLEGAVSNGIEEKVAHTIWNKMKTFASYGFNKSHAAVYSLITIQTAWLKTYYPTYFMNAVLNSFVGKLDTLQQKINITDVLGIEILPPTVNHSDNLFSVQGDKILFAFSGIRSMGMKGLAIVEERTTSGAFEDLEDFMKRMYQNHSFGVPVFQSLNDAGAFDEFELNRLQNKAIIPLLFDEIKKHIKEKKKQEANSPVGQIDLFELWGEEEQEAYQELNAFQSRVSIPTYTIGRKEFKKLAIAEKQALGIYLKYHPLNEFKDQILALDKEYTPIDAILATEELEEAVTATMNEMEIEELKKEMGMKSQYHNQKVKIVCTIDAIQHITTKRGDAMYILEVSDFTGTMKAVIFHQQINTNIDLIFLGNVVIIEGYISSDDYGTQITIRNMLDGENILKSQFPKGLYIRVHSKGIGTTLREIVKKYQGNTPVYYQFGDNLYKDPNMINLNDLNVIHEIENIVQSKNYKITY